MIEVFGKCGIYAKVLKHSISPAGIQLVTYEIAYPRLILAELNTHAMLAKNSASSRAIPFDKMAQNLTGRPVRFGQANPGMQDKGDEHWATLNIRGTVEGLDYASMGPHKAWEFAKDRALKISEAFYAAGYAKQIYNRLTEPFQMMKTVLSGTELANFFWLRNHGAADPTLHELARCMQEAVEQSTPELLQPGEWHLPYVEFSRHHGRHDYYIHEEIGDRFETVVLTLDQAKAVSAARCAAVSFRNVDYTAEKSQEVYNRLVGDDRKHASAFEHQATPIKPEFANSFYLINSPTVPNSWEPGVSHVDRNYNLWSGKLNGWIAQRKLIAGENVPGFSLETT